MRFERSLIRRDVRAGRWPDTMWTPAALPNDTLEEIGHRLEGWISALRSAGGEDVRAVLRSLPLDANLRQLLADAHVALGDLERAWQVLFEAVNCAPSEGAMTPSPLLVGWEDAWTCRYTQAQQCSRFGRLALLFAEREAAASDLDCGAADDFARHQSGKREKRIAEAVRNSRRQLADARRLFAAEIATLPADSTEDGAAAEWRLALRCALFGTNTLLVRALRLAGQEAEARTTAEQARREAADLQMHPSATPQLLRLLVAERSQIIDDEQSVAAG